MKKVIIILGLLGLTIFGGLYAKRKFYDPKHRLEKAQTEVKQLADLNEIKNGDLIFQTSLSGQSKAIWTCNKYLDIILRLDSLKNGLIYSAFCGLWITLRVTHIPQNL